jgi:hypothetical protein
MTRPCLVYVTGPKGPMPQVWHDPLVTEGGAPAVKPEGMKIVACRQLPWAGEWSIAKAESVGLG